MKRGAENEDIGRLERVNYSYESRKRTIRRIIQRLPRYMVLVLLLLAIYLVATESSIFQIKNINFEYEGEVLKEYFEKDSLERDLNDRYILQNYFQVDPSMIQDQLSVRSIHIKQLYVAKLFPDGLRVKIIYREPYLVVEHLEDCYLIDAENLLLEKSSKEVAKEEIDISELTEVTTTDENSDPPDDKSDQQDGCNIMKELQGPLPVAITDTSIQNIFNSGEFLYFEQLFILDGLFSDQGYSIGSIEIKSEGSVLSLNNNKRVIIDLDDDFEEQVKRLVLIMAQIEIDRPEFSELDVRYKRPVLRK